jgi:hypothetical protein
VTPFYTSIMDRHLIDESACRNSIKSPGGHSMQDIFEFSQSETISPAAFFSSCTRVFIIVVVFAIFTYLRVFLSMTGEWSMRCMPDHLRKRISRTRTHYTGTLEGTIHPEEQYIPSALRSGRNMSLYQCPGTCFDRRTSSVLACFPAFAM